MSKYTTEVRFICENYAGLMESKDYLDIDSVVESARVKIFNFKYPIFDEGYRGILESKILKHFYTREIGAETVALWKLWLNRKMNEVMPYYNKLYESELLKFNPLTDVDITTKRDVVNDGTRNDTGEKDTVNKDVTSTSKTYSSDTQTDDESWNYYSDTPQGGINGLSDNTYLTNATHDTDDNHVHVGGNETTNFEDNFVGNDKTKNDSKYNNVEDYLERVTGKRGGTTYSKMVKEFRETFLNIDMMVIHELDDLFFNLW